MKYLLPIIFLFLAACSSPNQPDIVVDHNGEGVCTGKHKPSGLRWRESPVYYYIDLQSFGLDAPVFEREIERGITQIESVSGADLERVYDIKLSNIRYSEGELDGRGGTLAVAYQASGDYEFMDDHKVMSAPFVGDIVFDVRDNPTSKSIHGVGLHETLHGLGIDHSPNRGDVMFAFFSGQDVMQPWDIFETVLRYGE